MVYTKHLTIHSIAHLTRSTKYIEDKDKTQLELQDQQNSHSHLDNIFSYVTDGKKTVGQQLVSSYGIIDIDQAEVEFLKTKEIQAKQRGTNYEVDLATGEVTFQQETLERNNAVLAHHLIQSFSPEDDLTPEAIHEIGRQTVMELTGGEYEFVIATHVNKEHIHNHIVFNATNMVTGKAYRWQKGTKKSFEEISDRIASKYGAKIIEKSPKNTHQKYTQWQANSLFKSQIKQRLDYLLTVSSDLDDFKVKAAALNLQVDFSGKWATYRLLDEPQVKNTRGRVLNKKDPEAYNLDRVVMALKNNQNLTISVEDVVANYHEMKEQVKNDFDYQVVIDDWQVDHTTPRGIYINVDFGVAEHGKLFIPGYKVDQLEKGQYALFIKQKDYFYFMNENKAQRDRYMTGASLVKQLSRYNGTVPLKKEPVLTTMNQLVTAINFLAVHGVTASQQVNHLQQQLQRALAEAETKLGELDQKIMALNQTAKQVGHGDQFEELQSELQAAQASRSVLQDQLSQTIKDMDYFNGLQASVKTKEAQEQDRPKSL
jgi:hypothetical protein